ncbi:hypothetical protein EET67_18645 [Pseudaminobacter arsenicus]|uniref:Uncharacterized protein n=1 Tax=Borborobacter arsenicus TaxID=1851146 RepID=A0A432V2F6_9HYPH|nr:hypothetical protein [Pseudaminobacter arsenicus]RUM96367.1 hypothetical protein EET67_18645 [Pseudaminobacter arsenicus]
MNYRAASLTIFPLSFIGLLSLERLSTYLVGLSPSSTFLWQASLELRALFRDLSNKFDLITGHSLLLQALMLFGCVVIICLTTQVRRWSAFSFLANHVTLLVAGVATMLAANFKVASSGITDAAGSMIWSSAEPSMTWLQLTVLATGILSCIWCHYLVVSHARADQARQRALLDKLQC